MDALLVVNAGSSSLKFQVFGIVGMDLTRQIRGKVDGIGTRPRLQATAADGTQLIDQTYDAKAVRDLPAAITEARRWLLTLEGFELQAVGHRVVHGGPDYTRPVLIDATVLDHLAGYQDLAPLHQPNNLAPIRLAMEINPDVPQVACFDTAFHRGHAKHTDCYALPRSFYDEGVRRYGFHGLSYEYIAERLREVASRAAKGRVVVAHLGSGASMCGLRDGRSIESTMLHRPSTGCRWDTPGQLDPGVVLYLILQKGMKAQAVSDLLYHDAGLKGLSGLSNDMRDLLASDDPHAALSVAHFVYRCVLNGGMLAAALGGIDAFVFTAGVGENSPPIRARIVEGLAWLGAELDPAANEAGAALISTATSRVAVHVLPTDEELMIARHTLALISAPNA
uniref:Acetate kinase n=1 Tax=Rhizobium meliloti TaxID=382 RepID=ACKA_RHIML|nr:RecName: Full=Acetate kinase; AltName: Full=Acetokinase [Sinorhizobium meliloti]AAD24358.1 acetate kinase [Sinorhizobium meliloti]